MPEAPAPKPPATEKFALEKAAIGKVTLLSLQGTLHNAFEGRKVAESIRTKNVVVSMRDVRRFASWGMTEWMDFLRINAERDLYVVECSTYAVGQINLVTGLLGHAKLVSFYASYRCGSCSEEFQNLFLIPRDRDAIRDLPGSHQQCTTCGGRARLEEYPAAFFDKIAERPAFDIDDEVLEFLRSHYKYDLAPDLNRFRAFRSARGGYTYLRLSGSLGRLPHEALAAASEGTTVVDLGGVTFDPADLTPWRIYVQAALGKLPSLQLLNCPPGFLETAVAPEDLQDKLKIRTFAVSYDCLRCNSMSVHMVDVAENLEQLVKGTAPYTGCPTCQSVLVAALSPDQITCLRSLPARDRDAALDRFLTRVRNLQTDELEDCLTAQPRKPAPAAPTTSRAMYIALGLCAMVIGGLAVTALELWRRSDAAPVVVAPAPMVAPSRPTFQRPDWILYDLPAAAYCHDQINRLMCVGVSSYRTSRDDAVTEANDAALEELVNTVGLKVSDSYFRETIAPAYSEVRSKALTALQAADIDRSSKAYAEAVAVVRKARRRVVEILQASGGAAVPSQRSDWYWEEYAGDNGKPNEILVFVRYDVPLDTVRALVEKYSTTTTVVSNSAMTASPALAWPYADFSGGALLTKVGRQLAAAGIAPQNIVMAVGEQRVADATSFARRFGEATRTEGALQLTVRNAESTQQVDIKRQPPQ
jgi:DNA-directed RNA polymerase subunit RPC12/RpoP